jgi:hypothetical protein
MVKREYKLWAVMPDSVNQAGKRWESEPRMKTFAMRVNEKRDAREERPLNTPDNVI